MPFNWGLQLLEEPAHIELAERSLGERPLSRGLPAIVPIALHWPIPLLPLLTNRVF